MPSRLPARMFRNSPPRRPIAPPSLTAPAPASNRPPFPMAATESPITWVAQPLEPRQRLYGSFCAGPLIRPAIRWAPQVFVSSHKHDHEAVASTIYDTP